MYKQNNEMTRKRKYERHAHSAINIPAGWEVQHYAVFNPEQQHTYPYITLRGVDERDQRYGYERYGETGEGNQQGGHGTGTTPPARRPEFHDMNGHILLKIIVEEREKLHVKKCLIQKKDKSKTADQEAGLIKLCTKVASKVKSFHCISLLPIKQWHLISNCMLVM